MKRRIATVIAVIGVALVGTQLARAWPRDVEVAYLLGPSAVALDVDYLEEGEAVSSARFTRAAMKSNEVRHIVRLQPGHYEARITLYRADGTGIEHSRALIVPAEGLKRFDLREATNGSR